MKIATSKRKGCFPASTEASGETPSPGPASPRPHTSLHSDAARSRPSQARPHMELGGGGLLHQGSDCPLFLARIHSKEAPAQSRDAGDSGLQTMRLRQEEEDGARTSRPLQPGAVRPHAGGSGAQTPGTLATTEHAHGSQAYNTHDASL